jgi:hypothetical protein
MNEITLTQLRKDKESLEERLTRILEQEFSYFKEITGFSVHGISSHFLNFTSFGDAHSVAALQSITVELEEI